MNTYAILITATGFLAIIAWVAWSAGYAAGKLDKLSQDLTPLDNGMTAEDAARRNAL